MILTAHQPSYMPWPPYLDRIRQADLFVLLDNRQFETNSFINRNRVWGNGQARWLTIPVVKQEHMGRSMLDMPLDERVPWARKQAASIRHWYADADKQKLDAVCDHLDRIGNSSTMVSACYWDLLWWVGRTGITTPMRREPRSLAALHKTEFIVALCQQCHADTFLAGPLFKDYADMDALREAGIKVRYHEYEWPNVSQPGLSTLHYWLTGELLKVLPWAKESL